jgi:hypothetical protein
VTGSLASWLYGVAHRVARRARSDAARRSRHERRAAQLAEAANHEVPAWHDDLLILGDEIERLPAVLRDVVVLCYLEGKTYDEAALGLGVAGSTVRGRLSRARRRLRVRLIRRGVTLSVELLLVQGLCRPARAACSVPLVETTVQAAIGIAAGKAAAATVITAPVATLTEGVLSSMFLIKLKTAAVLVSIALSICGTGVLARQAYGPASKHVVPRSESSGRQVDTAAEPKSASDFRDDAPGANRRSIAIARGVREFPAIVARVNGREITREELAEVCLARQGAKELDKLTQRAVLEIAMQDRRLEVTDAEMESELAALAASFRVAPAAFMTMLKKERGISSDEYRDVLYGRVAIRKLGAKTEDDQIKLFEALLRDARIQIYLPKETHDLPVPPRTTATGGDHRLEELERKVDLILESLNRDRKDRPKR